MNPSLRQLALSASQNAYAPYSKALVGCAVETSSGKIFTGCNIENASFGGTVCAERVAIWKAVSDEHSKLKRIYIFTQAGWPPCGMCLQVMSEFANPDLEVTIGNADGEEKHLKLKDLLPYAFTPKHME
jgi:cytidine deaminase